MLDEFCIDLGRYQQYTSLFPQASRLRTNMVSIYTEIMALNCHFIIHLKKNQICKLILFYSRIFYVVSQLILEIVGLFRTVSPAFEEGFNERLRKMRVLTSRIEAEARVASMEANKHSFQDLRNLVTDNHAAVWKDPAALPCYVGLPPKNTRFSGRREISDQIGALLVTSGNQQQNTFVLQGLGGVGKTELALNFTWERLQVYQVVLWITAEDEETLAQGFINAARQFGFVKDGQRSNAKDCLDSVCHWLSKTSM
jgi:hypothetical protein